VGAVLGAIEDQVLHLKRLPEGQRSFELVRSSASSARPRRGAVLEPAGLVANLRRLGSLHRVAEFEETEIAAVRETLDKAGIDPDQVRRDEVLLRYRRSPSIETIVSPCACRRKPPGSRLSIKTKRGRSAPFRLK
jgi:hypothetical protein